MTREGRYAPRKNIPTDIFTVRTEKAPTPAIRKSQFSEVHVARGGYDVRIGRGGRDPVISLDPTWRAVATRRECRRGCYAPGLTNNRSPPNGARRGQACWSVPICSREGDRNYFSELLIEVNLSLRFVPTPLTTAIMASAMPAAIRPYSIAVAPDSSDKKFNKVRFNSAS